MNKTVGLILAVSAILVIGIGLVYLGVVLGRYGWFPQIGQSNAYRMPGSFMMNPNVDHSPDECDEGMMGGYGMMGGSGMMGGYFFNSSDAEPLTIAEAEQAVHDYIEGFQGNDLAIGEIMIFDNHGYAEIVEESTGIGAMEVLIDPATSAVYPEYGPNMMWNQKYGHMGGSGGYGMGGMMSGSGMMGYGYRDFTSADPENMPVSAEEAVGFAQEYLDHNVSGTRADDHADPFYGYYTIHILQDGKVIGMLSVNGFSGNVFLHTWHGDFIEMSEEH